MADTTPLAQHPPAVKVGGRRLSISAKPKHPPTTNEPQSPASPEERVDPVDYPRPGPRDQEHPPHHEEDGPKKEKKHHHGNHENDKKIKESAQWKVEATRPTRDTGSGRKDFGAGGRIAQPAGKGF